MDWRAGENPGNPESGIRVMTGGDDRDRTSKNVPFINREEWATHLNQGVEPVVIDDSYRLALVQGIVTYDWSRVKIVPRDADDLLGVRNDGGCSIDTVVSRGKLLSAKAAGLKVYPNPAQNFLNISAEVNLDHLELLDVNGRAVLNTGVSGAQNDLISYRRIRPRRRRLFPARFQ